MTEISSPPRSSLDSVHYDIGVLKNQQSNTDVALGRMGDELSKFVTVMSASIERLGSKIDARDSTRPNLAGLSASVTGIITVVLIIIGAFFASLKSPIDALLVRHDTQITHLEEVVALKDDLKELAASSVSQRQLGEVVLRIDQRDASEKTDFNTLQKQVNDLLAAETLAAAALRSKRGSYDQ